MVRDSRTYVIRKASQLAALASPPRLRIVESFSILGAASIKAVAERIERVPASLYYHVRELQRVGLLVEDGVERSGRRSEKRYALVAPQLKVDPSISSTAYRKALADCCRAVVRLAERNFVAAVEKGDFCLAGAARSLMSHRRVVHLTRDGLAQLNRAVDQLERVLHEQNTKNARQSYALTTILAPLEP